MTESGCHYQLFLREDVPAHAARHQQSLVDRLRGQVDAVTVTRWPKRVRRWSDGDVLDRYDEFAHWADERDADLSPFFGSRGVYSFEDGRQFDALVLPVCCLAIYHDDELEAVYPHTAGGTHYSVEDALELLGGAEASEAQTDAEPAD
ncbi:HTH domain-containing protein [Halorarius litoreus]|uniref:HTH domain-containing protein n=1 Tax=Halorarius litoreus TaxID=2962676 RepID=UPI0020CBF47F|nr:HTH domain-containing protein [Halorarius litoreus]